MYKRLTGSVVVDRSAEHLYKMWSHLQDFLKFMRHIKSAIPTGRLTSHWVMEGFT